MISTSLPTPAQLRAAPQLAALAILDAALVTAEEMLLAHHPARDNLDGDLDGTEGTSSLEGSLVAVLIARFDELHHLLGRYYAAVRAALLAANDDFPF
jgi:hypothetical protein